MNLEEIMRSAMNQSNGKSEPVCMMRDQPELSNEHTFHNKKMAAFHERKKKIDSEMEETRKGYWVELEKKLVEKGLLTQKEVDADIGLRFQDGVLFKHEEMKKK